MSNTDLTAPDALSLAGKIVTPFDRTSNINTDFFCDDEISNLIRLSDGLSETPLISSVMTKFRI
jgi:hypothetical protein